MERYKRKNKIERAKRTTKRERKAKARTAVELRPAWGKDLYREEYLFVREYLEDLNKTQAMLRVKPHLKYTTAQVESGRLCKKDHIRKAIAEALAEELDVPKHRIIQELSRQAFFNPREFVRWDKNGDVEFTPTEDLTDDQMAAVQSIHKNNSGLHIKFNDKLGAIDRLAKTLGIVQEQEAANNAPAPVIVNVIRFTDAPPKPPVEIVPPGPQPAHPIIDVPLLEGPKNVQAP